MKKTYYEKVGRRYIPVAEYDDDYLNSLPKGAHLVMVYPGGTSRRFNVDPNYVAMIAAGRVAENAMCDAMRKASELRPARMPITPEQQAAWKNLSLAFGEELSTLHGSSLNDVAQAGITALIEEAEQLMQNPNVREAYDHFLVVCKLTKETQNAC
jgi:hypothetical protein